MEFLIKSGGGEDLKNYFKKATYYSFGSVFFSMLYFLIKDLFYDDYIISHFVLWFNIFSFSWCFKFLNVFIKIVLYKN
ncbi:hypothetical protein HYN49_10095 [Flavobacterium pallidum]|uniref:Uncharacterized protein n=1 Tax=Flavobacterium pallidum TaxID=2172098 RepID=A0A2S1SIQ5_9FLAO|nr:hypothetical protein HYN49_10095 [Flavobacterium pallidum]